MRTLTILCFAVMLLLACSACHTARHKSPTAEDYQLATAQSAFLVRTLKALDAGDTNTAYRFTLLHLRDCMLRMQRFAHEKAVQPYDKGTAKAVSLYVLSYVEKNKEHLGADASSDHCALQITMALSDAMTTPEELKRIQALRDFFSERFIEERELYE